MTQQSAASPISRALSGHCPHCGKGSLFRNILELQPRCQSCGFDNTPIAVGDGPAVFAIFILGVLVLGGALYVEFTFLPAWWVHAVLWGLLTPLFAIVLLRFLKAVLIGQTYKHMAAEGRLVNTE